MINICLYGASGKMGKAVISAADISLDVISLTVISSVFFNVTLPVLP